MRSIAICALLTPVIAGGGLALWPQGSAPAASMPSPSMSQAAVVALTAASNVRPSKTGNVVSTQPQTLDLHTAIEHGQLSAEFRGNGRDTVRAILTNRTGGQLTVRVAGGQMFESGTNLVVVLRSGEVELRPGTPVEVTIQTAATRSANKFADRGYTLSYGTLPRLKPLLTYAQNHPELSTATLQTAVLALTENLPLSAVSKFSAAGADLPTHFDTSAFRVETGDIVHALLTLRAIGVRDGDLAMNIDPQLKVEAMIEPLTRPFAMRYYGITPATEWDYWKSELLSGDEATRHYALYGIARFYPDIALEMLPKWARETKMAEVFRISAIQALADTQRPEALPILEKLSDEFGSDTELGKAASNSAKFLNTSLAKLSANRTATVSFRSSVATSQFQ
ncbi:HEAT repeat domain-containing protein [Chthoniobacter flavus]|nr:HEAT repeat domain-containing protein [Chthoniobacter flavus]